LCELLERSESETVSLSLACASAIVNKLSSSQSSRGAVLKHFVGTSAYAPSASITIPPSPSFFLAEALLKLLHQKKRILNDPQVLTNAALIYFIIRLCHFISSPPYNSYRLSLICQDGVPVHQSRE
jgi:hypothetical protein